MLLIPNALNPLQAHPHTAHTSLVLGFSMFISTAEMQTTHTSICDHPRDTSKGNGNGRTFSTPYRCSNRESETAQAPERVWCTTSHFRTVETSDVSSSPNETHTSSAQGFNSALFGSYFWLKTSNCCLKWNLPAANKSGKLLLYVNKVSLLRCLIALWSCTLVNSDRLKVVYFWLPAVA